MPRRYVDRGIPARALVREIRVDFATVAIGQGAGVLTVESIVEGQANAPLVDKMTGAATEPNLTNIDLPKLPKNNLLNLSCVFTDKLPDARSISPIKLQNFEMLLASHPDRQKVNYVVNGLRFGFTLGFQPQSCKLKSVTSNPSAYEHPTVIDDYLTKENEVI